MVVMSLPLFGVGFDDIRLWKRNLLNKGLGRMVCASTAKFLGAPLRSSQKMNDGKCKWLLLLLSLKTQDR